MLLTKTSDDHQKLHIRFHLRMTLKPTTSSNRVLDPLRSGDCQINRNSPHPTFKLVESRSGDRFSKNWYFPIYTVRKSTDPHKHSNVG